METISNQKQESEFVVGDEWQGTKGCCCPPSMSSATALLTARRGRLLAVEADARSAARPPLRLLRCDAVGLVSRAAVE